MFSIFAPLIILLTLITITNKYLFYACFSLLISFVVFSGLLAFWGERILSFIYLIMYVRAVGIIFTFRVLVIRSTGVDTSIYLEIDIHLIAILILTSSVSLFSYDRNYYTNPYSILYSIWITPEISLRRDLLLYEWLYSTHQIIFLIVFLILCALYSRMLVTENYWYLENKKIKK